MAVVVTWDRDFKRLVGRVPIGERLRFRPTWAHQLRLPSRAWDGRRVVASHRIHRVRPTRSSRGIGIVA
jgi:hypothetical protein